MLTTSSAGGGPPLALEHRSLDVPHHRLLALEALLSRGELERARRLGNFALRVRFVAARGQLREILGQALGVPAREIEIGTAPWGKPFVSSEPSSPLSFSVSHTARRAVYALSDGCEVGVDIEAVRSVGDELRIASMVCTRAELGELRGAHPDVRTAWFYRLWVCKEAVCKADGRGLGLPPRTFEVPRELWAVPLEDRADSAPDSAVVWADGRPWLVQAQDMPQDGMVLAIAASGDPGVKSADRGTARRSGGGCGASSSGGTP